MPSRSVTRFDDRPQAWMVLHKYSIYPGFLGRQRREYRGTFVELDPILSRATWLGPQEVADE